MAVEKLTIDWASMPTYNTVMAVAAGAGLCSIARTLKAASGAKGVRPRGWALNFGVLGAILFLTGGHMTLTWPLATYFPFDNIIFGEPALAFGVLLMGLAFYTWTQADLIQKAESPIAEMAAHVRPLRYFLYGMGLACVAIACAGMAFRLFTAPAEEPISGLFADRPMLEASAISGLYAMVGLAACLAPTALDRFAERPGEAPSIVQKLLYALLMVTGTIWLLFGALNYFTHIGLIVHTMH